MIERSISNVILELNNQITIFLLAGSVLTGKTTLLKHLSSNDCKYLDLTDPALRVMANEEPVLFLQRYAPPVLIDNIQYAPDLVPVIKDYVLHNGCIMASRVIFG